MFSDHFPIDGKIGVITGGSQGLGLQLAVQTYAQGASVVIVSRSEAKLKKAKEEILKQPKVRKDQFVEYFSADLADHEAAERILPFLDKLGAGNPDFLFCCAGGAHPQYFLNMTQKDLQFGMDVNYMTCVNIVHILAPRMITEPASYKGGALDDIKKVFSTPKSARHIVLFSSEVAFYNFIGYAEYGPAKAALKAFGDAIRHELKPYDVVVQVAFPGNMDTEGYVEENRLKPVACKEIEGMSKPASAEDCAKSILKGMKSGDLYLQTDLIGWVLNSFSLGFNPRKWALVQVVLALVGALFGSLIDLFHQTIIQKEFRTQGGFKKKSQ